MSLTLPMDLACGIAVPGECGGVGTTSPVEASPVEVSCQSRTQDICLEGLAASEETARKLGGETSRGPK